MPTSKPEESGLIFKVEKFLQKKYQFRYNVVTGRISQKCNGAQAYTEINDFEMNTLHRELLKGSVNCSIDLLRRTLHSNFSSPFNPFTDYLLGLPHWDKKTDHIKDLAQTVTAENQPYWESSIKKWLVGLVASLSDDNKVNQTALILVGGQGIGKSMWIDKLVPAILDEYKYSGMVHPGDKDTQIKLSESMLIVCDELEGLTSGNISSVKEMITKPYIHIRRPYMHFHQKLVRRASFAGSVNSTQFLKDDTGNRRFLCFKVDSIDYQHSISMDNVYAQALYLFNQGFQSWFDQNEIREVNEQNKKFRSLSLEELVFDEVFISPTDNGLSDFEGSASEVLECLVKTGKISNSERFLIRIGKLLSARGIEPFKKHGRKVYALNFLKKADDKADELKEAS